MATVATRAPKRELAPDWRDALRNAVRRLAVRSWGALLVAVSLGGAVALATHNPTDPSLSTAAGGPPANWLGASGAYFSDALLLLFGLGSVLFLPVIAIAGLRMIRLEPAGRIGRGLVLAGIGAVLIGVALGLTSGSAVSGLPGGWGGALGLAAAHGVDAATHLIRNPQVAGPVRFAGLLVFAIAGSVVGYAALGLTGEERRWIAGLLKRQPRERRAAPRRTEIAGDDDRLTPAAPPRSRPTVAVAEPARAPAAAARGPGRRSQSSLALGDSFVLPTIDLLARPPEKGKQQIDRAGLERNARLLEIGARGFPRPRRHRRGSARAGGHDVRARTGQRDQGEPRDPARRRHRPQHVGAVGASRDNSGPQRDRHRAAQSQARSRRLVRADRESGVRGPEHGAAADPGQEYRRRPGDRRSRADAASAGRRNDRIGQVGRPQLHDPVAALPVRSGPVQTDHDRSRRCSN